MSETQASPQTREVVIYHQNIPGPSIAFAMLIWAFCNISNCAGKSTNFRAREICEATTGKDDARCVGYFAR